MGLRFWRRKTLFPGLRMNLSKSGVSLSAGRPGMWATVGRRGRTVTIGAPGTGLRWTEHYGSPQTDEGAWRASHGAQLWAELGSALCWGIILTCSFITAMLLLAVIFGN
jgi:hypothetical protein